MNNQDEDSDLQILDALFEHFDDYGVFNLYYRIPEGVEFKDRLGLTYSPISRVSELLVKYGYATILNKNATPVPIPINVNMFKCHVTTDFQALSKNIQGKSTHRQGKERQHENQRPMGWLWTQGHGVCGDHVIRN